MVEKGKLKIYSEGHQPEVLRPILDQLRLPTYKYNFQRQGNTMTRNLPGFEALFRRACGGQLREGKDGGAKTQLHGYQAWGPSFGSETPPGGHSGVNANVRIRDHMERTEEYEQCLLNRSWGLGSNTVSNSAGRRRENCSWYSCYLLKKKRKERQKESSSFIHRAAAPTRPRIGKKTQENERNMTQKLSKKRDI